jgi:hypothetical protein
LQMKPLKPVHPCSWNPTILLLSDAAPPKTTGECFYFNKALRNLSYFWDLWDRQDLLDVSPQALLIPTSVWHWPWITVNKSLKILLGPHAHYSLEIRSHASWKSQSVQNLPQKSCFQPGSALDWG